MPFSTESIREAYKADKRGVNWSRYKPSVTFDNRAKTCYNGPMKTPTFRIDYRFKTQVEALRVANPSENLVVIVGDENDDAPYWVMTVANAKKAEQAGYEWL